MKRAILSLAFLTAVIYNLTFANQALRPAYAEDTEELKKCVCENKITEATDSCLESSRNEYFKDNRYQEFVGLLRGLCPGNKDIAPYLSYNIALTRYQQLKYLEESKVWDEYFAKGNDYRDEIVKEAGQAADALPKDSPAFIYSRLILYRFHKDQQDAFSEQALSDLLGAAEEYAKFNKDITPLKEAADTLRSYEEGASSRKLYKLYSQALVKSDIKDAALKDIAAGFYGNGNLELAESIYDAYIERAGKALSKNELMQELKEIAQNFSYKDKGHYDMAYAEKVFKKIEELWGMKAFDEELIYLRGFNLEKSKEYLQAKDTYSLLLKMYPQSRYVDEATFKAGVICVYALRDLKSGREYFSKIADKKPLTMYSLSSLYQLGLLKQWEGDFNSAKVYYSKLIDKAQEGFNGADILHPATERMKEVEGSAPIEHNLKVFLDAALKNEFSSLDMSKINLKSNIYMPAAGESIDIGVSVYLASSGCFNVELQYLWSGDLGGATPGIKDPGFKSSYKSKGTKVIGLVLISPSGITDYAFDLIDAN